MGTDIHMIGERFDKYDEKYTAFAIPDKFTGRYYSLFAVLGSVRNGFGFAGCYRHEPVKPVSDCRGIPEDASKTVLSVYNSNDMEDFGWLGDHSFSYVTLKELKDYKWPKVIQGGVMPYSEWLKWDKITRPDTYSGGITGKDIITIDESEVESAVFKDDKRYYVSFRFKDNLVDPEFVSEFIDFLSLFKRYGADDNSVRIVFGFDS